MSKRSTETKVDGIKAMIQNFTKMQLLDHIISSKALFTIVDGSLNDRYFVSLIWGHMTNSSNLITVETILQVDDFDITCRFNLRVHKEEWRSSGLGFKLIPHDAENHVYTFLNLKTDTLSNCSGKQHEITIIDITRTNSEPFVIKKQKNKMDGNPFDESFHKKQFVDNLLRDNEYRDILVSSIKRDKDILSRIKRSIEYDNKEREYLSSLSDSNPDIFVKRQNVEKFISKSKE